MACCHDVWDSADSKPLGSLKLCSAAAHTTGYCWTVLVLEGIASFSLCRATCTVQLSVNGPDYLQISWIYDDGSNTVTDFILFDNDAKTIIGISCCEWISLFALSGFRVALHGCVWAKLTHCWHRYLSENVNIWKGADVSYQSHPSIGQCASLLSALTLSLHFVVSLCSPVLLQLHPNAWWAGAP